jgi:hypothetical protein
MDTHSPAKRTLALAATALVVFLGIGTAACSSSSSDGAAGTTTTAPEEARTSDAKVAEGLSAINKTATEIAAAAAVDKTQAAKLDEDIEPVWSKIEGTVKANSEDIYIDFEDAFAVLGKAAKDGDATAAGKAVKSIATATTKYLKAHPA